MENLRNDENAATEGITLLSQAPQAYVPIVQPAPPSERVTYAQIFRPEPAAGSPEQLNFRLQTPQQTPNDYFTPVTTGGSTISDVSSGYIDLTQNLARPAIKRNVRPTSPETSF